MLKSVKGESSTSIKAEYHFVDPFGTLGMVYLELHKVSNMPSGASIKSLYENEDGAYDEYWSGSSYSRTSISAYDTSYTFSGLTPGESYYVVLAHVNEDINGEIERTLDDYSKVSTRQPSNKLTISTVDRSSIGFELSLESVDSAARYVQLQDDAGSTKTELSGDDIRAAVSTGYSGSISVDSNLLKTLSSITLYVKDASDNILLRAQSSNSFYESSSGGE